MTIWAVLASVAAGWPTAIAWQWFAALAAATAIHVAWTRPAEERRRAAHLAGEHIDHTGVWTVAAALVLPAHLLVVLVAGIRTHRYLIARKPPVRVVYGTAGILASALAAQAIATTTPLQAWLTAGVGGVGPVVSLSVLAVASVALGAYYLVQTVLLAVARWTGQRLEAARRDTIDRLNAAVSAGGLDQEQAAERRGRAQTTITRSGLARLVHGLPTGTDTVGAMADMDGWHHPQQMLTRLVRRAGWVSVVGTRKQNVDFVQTMYLGLVAAWSVSLASGLMLAVVAALAVWYTRQTQQIESLIHERDELKADALHDTLTGLLNRRGFEAGAAIAFADADRRSTQLAVLMVDIDFFKRVNDNHGHPNGDLVLKSVADVLAATTRPTDLCGRFGGEEFVVILTNSGPDAAVATAERIRHNVEQTEVVGTDPRGGSERLIRGLSVSIGLSVYPVDGSDYDKLEREADLALYEAKNSGRNRVKYRGTLLDANPADQYPRGRRRVLPLHVR